MGFQLTSEDLQAVQVAIDVARRLMHHPETNPEYMPAITKALDALRRLPEPTPGCDCGFGIHYRAGDREFSERKYMSFSISEAAFEISMGGSVYEAGIGSDSYDEGNWYFEDSGYARRECELFRIEGQAGQYLNLGAEITSWLDEE